MDASLTSQHRNSTTSSLAGKNWFDAFVADRETIVCRDKQGNAAGGEQRLQIDDHAQPRLSIPSQVASGTQRISGPESETGSTAPAKTARTHSPVRNWTTNIPAATGPSHPVDTRSEPERSPKLRTFHQNPSIHGYEDCAVVFSSQAAGSGSDQSE